MMNLFSFILISSSVAFAQSADNLFPCTLNALIDGQCAVSATAYIYDNEFGPRALVSQANYETVDNENQFVPDLGWHTDSNQIIWNSSTLSPMNIKKGKVIFGVTGELDNTVYSDCTYYQTSTDTVSPNAASSCYVPSGSSNYVYSSFFGGRQNVCSFVQVDATSYKLINKYDPLKPKGACWIDTNGVESDGFNINNSYLKKSGVPNYVIRNTASAVTCPISGPSIGYQSVSCTTPDRTSFNGYFYPSSVLVQINGANKWVSGAYGGRAKNCIYGTNSEPCWIDDPDAYVENDTSCTEKIPDGSTGSLGTALNSYSCKTNGTAMTVRTNNNQVTNTVGRFVYRYARGGRNNDCTQSTRTGYCYMNGYNKSDIEPDLIPANIQNGLVLYGVRGNLTLAEIVYGSGAHRTPSGTASPNRMAYKQTSSGESNILEANPSTAASALYPSAYHPVPKVSTDSEADVVGVNRTGWTNTQCGLTGTITARIANCASTFGANASWKGTVKGNAGQADWDLVTRKVDSVDTSKTYEVWRDSGTGLMWSSLVSTALNWCKASGSNGKQNSSGYEPATSSEDDPSNYCDSASYQDQTTPVSACYLDDDQGSGIFQFSTIYNQDSTPGKAGLLPTLTPATGRVYWRLPTIYDYILANHHGLRFVLPDVGVNSDEEWTATVSANNRKNAWTYSGKFGTRQFKQRNNPAAVRCIGR